MSSSVVCSASLLSLSLSLNLSRVAAVPCYAQKIHHHSKLQLHGHRLSLSHFSAPRHSLCAPKSDGLPEGPGVVSVMDFEEFVDKDWSFLDSGDTNSEEERARKADRIICAGEIGDESRVLVSMCGEDFVDKLVHHRGGCELLLIVHESLFALACIKEKHDKVKCWQGELIFVPHKWTPFDVVFLYYLPALPLQLSQVFEALALRCLPGARVVISHPQGRTGAEQQRQQYPDIITSDMPSKLDLHKAATDHSFQVAELVDEPDFYLAVLKCVKS